MVLVVLVGACPFVTVALASAARQETVETVDAHDVAIVFGAGLSYGQPGQYLAARLRVALELFQAGKVQVILVSGDYLTPPHNEPGAMLEWLVERGVPAEKIVQDFAGEDTYSTCVRAREIFGVDRAILVSQTYHLPRAITTCRLAGVDAVGVGDQTMQAISESWRRYQLREIPAIIKMAWDVLTGRVPILGDYETGVDEALGR